MNKSASVTLSNSGGNKDINRWQRFLALAQHSKEAETARQFLVSLEIQPQSEGAVFGDRSPAEWLAWAREWLDRFDPLIRGREMIYGELANTGSGTVRNSYEL